MDERKVISELIELYRDLPCLWDISREDYKDSNKKRLSWELLVTKYKEIEPDANVASVKKKMDNLRSSFKREVAKVKASKTKGSGSSDVHKPSLWYFDLMSFLENKNHQRSGVDTNSSDNESSSQLTQTVKIEGNIDLDIKRENLQEAANNIPQQTRKEYNTFGIYIGEQIETLPKRQRLIAEKLISDVIFLAKTGNLDVYSRVETGADSLYIPRYTRLPSIAIPDNNNPTPQDCYHSSSSLPVLSSPESSDPLAEFPEVRLVSIPRPSPSQNTQPDESGSQTCEGTTGSLLEELLSDSKKQYKQNLS